MEISYSKEEEQMLVILKPVSCTYEECYCIVVLFLSETEDCISVR